MKTLTLKDGSSLSLEDNSTVGTFVIKVDNYSVIDTIKAQLTKDNLSDITLGVVGYTDVINEKVLVDMDDNGAITARFLNRMSTSDIVSDAIDSYTEELLEGGIIE